MVDSRDINSFFYRNYDYTLEVKDDNTYDLYSSSSTNKTVFFGIDRDILNFDIKRIIDSLDRLIKAKNRIESFTYEDNIISISTISYYNDSCFREKYHFNVVNDKNNDISLLLDDLLSNYQYVKKETDRNLKIYNNMYQDVCRIAGIAYELLEDYRISKYSTRRLSDNDVKKVLSYIEKHKREVGLKANIYKKSIIYNTKLIAPLFISAATIGSIVASKVTNIRPGEDTYNMIVNMAIISTGYNILFFSYPDIREFYKEAPNEKYMNKFIEEYKSIHSDSLNIDRREVLRDRLLSRIDDDIIIAGDQEKDELLVLKEHLNKHGVDEEKVFQELINIEKEIDRKIDNIEYFYSCLELLGVRREELEKDTFIGYLVEDIKLINNNEKSEEYYRLLELGRRRIREINDNDIYLNSYLNISISKLVEELESVEKDINEKKCDKCMVAKLNIS